MLQHFPGVKLQGDQTYQAEKPVILTHFNIKV